MERYSYLWGTQGKNYCELGRADKLETMLRSLGTTNPELALDEVKQMFFGFATLPGYGEQKQPPLNIRYAPVYLNKKPFYALRQMQPLAAICVNGLEKAGGSRESVYSYLTIMRRDELLTQHDFSVVDELFGGKLLTADEEEKHKLGTKPIDFAQGCKRAEVPDFTGKANQELRKICIRAVWELYKGTDHRVVIRVGKNAPFMEHARRLLAGIYSLLPEKLAADTGFSVYEKPENIRDCIDKLNTRIFILPAECQVDREAHLTENSVLLECAPCLVEEKETVPAEASDKAAAGNAAGEASDNGAKETILDVAGQASEGTESETSSKAGLSTDGYQHVNDAYRDQLLQKLAVYMRAGDGGPSQDIEWLMTKWCELPWEKRLPVIVAVFADETSYLNKDEYFARLEAFFNNDFFKWEREDKIPLAFADDTESLVKETVALYKEYRSFPICRAIAWTKDAFAMQIPAILTEGHTIDMLLEAMTTYNSRIMTPEAHRKCEAYTVWLKDMAKRSRLVQSDPLQE